ncbi:MAG: hypothetical protein VYB84_07875 [Pseudomonadota bacterium]|nr:hypothetical protein [Pseudomonadota bacterium]
MVLHHLYGQQQLADCLTLVGADDTLLIMDAGLLEVAGDTLSALPCDVMLLGDIEFHGTDRRGLPVINISGWLELVCQYPHSMSWA